LYARASAVNEHSGFYAEAYVFCQEL
jgi:hypothetical protein